MNFKYKCALQTLLSALPQGERLNFYFQRYVTRNLPVSRTAFLGKVGCALWYQEMYEQYHQLDEREEDFSYYYEFGAGADLIIPLTMSQLDHEVFAIDIRPLFESYLVKDSLHKFDEVGNELPFTPKKWAATDNLQQQLTQDFRLHYLAPKDARNTAFKANFFNFTSSTSVFEHIPNEDILPILQETYRILKPGGICCMIIDYRDHWSFFDQKLSVYHFLQYEEKDWKRYNPSLHFQNRLRHTDYLAFIAQTDFETISIQVELPTKQECSHLTSLPLSSSFQSYTQKELAIKSSRIVLRKPLGTAHDQGANSRAFNGVD